MSKAQPSTPATPKANLNHWTDAMETNHQEPGKPASTTTPAPAISQASRECAREIALDCAWAIGHELSMIEHALTIGADFQARLAWRELRRVGGSMSKAMEALGPLPGPDGAVVSDPTRRGVLQ